MLSRMPLSKKVSLVVSTVLLTMFCFHSIQMYALISHEQLFPKSFIKPTARKKDQNQLVSLRILPLHNSTQPNSTQASGSAVCYCYSSPHFVRSNRSNAKNVRGTSGKTLNLSGLNSIQSYHLEVSILERLNSVVSHCVRHWPKITQSNNKTLSFSTSWDGLSLQTPKGRKQFCELSVNSVIDQGRCIEEHLAKCNVTHNDWGDKNVLIDQGHLTLFDFNIATLDGKPDLHKKFAKYSILTRLLQQRLLSCGNWTNVEWNMMKV
mmetsp:Transcript_98553/g.158910  ORF Transcript_98553/g.158910 Transcript_98553/m.158910 type:complete len:264 (-) Transcript_98553:1295-2086(-)